MANHVLLNNVDHASLRVATGHSEALGSRIGLVPVFATEFSEVQREYPILLRPDSSRGGYQAVALLGFAGDENLFLDDDGWRADYVPAIVERGPFLIGFQEQEIDGEIRREPVIHIDLDSPRVSESGGEPIFLPHGGNTPYLERIAAILKGIHSGMAVSDDIFAAFAELHLIEPVNISVEIHRDDSLDLTGYYTVNEEKLADLDGAALERLNRAGFLQYAFFIASSLGNIRRLIERKRRRVMATAAGATDAMA
ncbi:SapC family protein [uncultured Microbulbifer sp.]|mgnify:CR=1 FL=1|uniref:SapC family protein n=1 Tax=uncultured Microbulbifer sp. TaxID=348147 RepID=UPI0025E1CD6A|nr:SapC family protein [uncultured Microbulbifer sp.]